MEDQGKRLLIAVGLVAALYLIWSYFFMPKPKPQPEAQGPAATASSSAAVAQGPTSQPSSMPAGTADATPVEKCVPDASEIAPWETPDWTATFSKCGGTFMSWRLKDKQYRRKEDNQPIDLVLNDHANPQLYPLQVQVGQPASGSSDPNEARVPQIPDGATWKLLSRTDDQVQFQWASPDKGLEVTKTFRRTPGKFVVAMDVEVKNVSTSKRVTDLAVDVFGWQDPNAKSRSMFHYAEPHWTALADANGKLKTEWMSDLKRESKLQKDVSWVGVGQKYFLLATAPTEKDTFTGIASAPPAPGAFDSRLVYTTPVTLDPGQVVKRTLVVYGGPKILDQLETVDKVAGKDVRMTSAVELGFFSFIARPMMSLLRMFHGWVGNWGLAIIMLTILVKLITLYWTQKSMRSMKAMSRLKPKIDEIRHKYENDKQRMNQEMMNLYRAHNINPLGGCLPMLLQMPVWWALYSTLGNAAELYRAPFAWLRDLTAPDPLFVMPILLVVLMFFQTRLSPASVDQSQQKMMQYMMPIMFGGMSLVFPSGLTVYILTNTILSVIHQIYMNRTEPTLTPAPTPPPAEPSPTPPRKGGRGNKKMAKA